MSPQVETYLTLAIAGMAGAIVRSLLIHKGSILWVRKWEKDGKVGIDLGVFGAMMIGAAVGIVIDQHPLAAFLGAISGSFILEEATKRQKLPPPPPGDEQ